jgi:hypothetical protein
MNCFLLQKKENNHMSEQNDYLEQTVETARHLVYCADFGELTRQDDSCSDFFGIVRDSAYKIMKEAERERTRHMNREAVGLKRP